MKVTVEADREADEARRYYEQQQPGLGDAFAAALADALERIRSAPETCPIEETAKTGDGVRRITLRRFPYSVLFTILNGEPIVFAVVHLRRRPGYWQSRVMDLE
jgi:hypothetical protein